MSEQKVGLLRSISGLSEPVTKGNFTWYSKELTLDDGKTYKRWSTDTAELELEHLIDKEITYSINDKGNIQLHGLPKVVKNPIPAASSGVNDSTSYWNVKSHNDQYDLVVRERQYFITHAREFLIPLGKISEANCEELAEKAIQLGIEWHKSYGKYKFE